MPGILNLDEVVTQRTEITKTVGKGEKHTWSLRDDIPTETMLLCFTLMEHAAERSDPDEAMQAARRAAETEGASETRQIVGAMNVLRSRMEEQMAETLDVCLAIWQHSYPETTREELRDWFNHTEREQIVQLFFYRRLTGSGAPSSDSTPTATATAKSRAKKRRASSGGIPSQKQLSRQLKGAL